VPAPQAWQHVYLGALYGLLALKSVLVDDFAALAAGAIGAVRLRRLTAGELAVFWAGKAGFAALFVALPVAAGTRSWGLLAAAWLVSELVAGWMLAFLFQVGATASWLHMCRLPLAGSLQRTAMPQSRLFCLSMLTTQLASLPLSATHGCMFLGQVAHVVGDVAFMQQDGAPGVPKGWAAAQAATSADFSHGSFFWTHISGGLNYQVRRWQLHCDGCRGHQCQQQHCVVLQGTHMPWSDM
jgi:acyl-lipid (8-3)-desaturase